MTLYSNRLSREVEEDVLTALEKLAEMPRQEYELALPDLGAMVALVEVCRLARQNRSEAEKNKRGYNFICDYCGFQQAGFYTPDDPKVHEKRICRSFYTPSKGCLPWGQICGREMRTEKWDVDETKRSAA